MNNYDLFALIAYLLLVIAIGFFARTRTKDHNEFFLANLLVTITPCYLISIITNKKTICPPTPTKIQ